MRVDPSLSEFRKLVSGPDEEIDLARAALEVARMEYPDLDPEPILEGLDALAARVAARSRGVEDPLARVATLSGVLFGEMGLRGATEDYYDPRNSYLNDVLERRRGIPISLSILFLGVGSRAGVPVGGASLPMHFLVRVLGVRPPVFVDCFDGGRTMDLAGCAEFFERMSNGQVAFDPSMVDLASNGEILTRLLNNLKLVLRNAGDHARVLATLDRLLALNPGEPTLLRERGLVLYRLGDATMARRDLQDYLSASVDPPDAREIRDLLRRIG